MPTPILPDATALKEAQVLEFQRKQQEAIAAAAAYLSSTPELDKLLRDFAQAVLSDRPSNVIQYAAQYFEKYNPLDDNNGQDAE